ncbi:MAG: hypothetical protein KAS30_05990 [Candidatus Diapherotrites archaeon]|nr:hypothetical protein [Candidatus Diapherotrites archaeon]
MDYSKLYKYKGKQFYIKWDNGKIALGSFNEDYTKLFKVNVSDIGV